METPNKTPENNEQGSKPVGYGSSIQTDGYGNRNRPPHESDVNPTTQQDHLQKIKDGDESSERVPKTDQTGSNNAVPTSGSLVINKEDQKNNGSADE